MNDTEAITAKEAAKRLGCSIGKVYSLWHTGMLKGYCVGRKKLVYAASILAFRRAHENTRPAGPSLPPGTGLSCLKLN